MYSEPDYSERHNRYSTFKKAEMSAQQAERELAEWRSQMLKQRDRVSLQSSLSPKSNPEENSKSTSGRNKSADELYDRINDLRMSQEGEEASQIEGNQPWEEEEHRNGDNTISKVLERMENKQRYKESVSDFQSTPKIELIPPLVTGYPPTMRNSEIFVKGDSAPRIRTPKVGDAPPKLLEPHSPEKENEDANVKEVMHSRRVPERISEENSVSGKMTTPAESARLMELERHYEDIILKERQQFNRTLQMKSLEMRDVEEGYKSKLSLLNTRLTELDQNVKDMEEVKKMEQKRQSQDLEIKGEYIRRIQYMEGLLNEQRQMEGKLQGLKNELDDKTALLERARSSERAEEVVDHLQHQLRQVKEELMYTKIAKEDLKSKNKCLKLEMKRHTSPHTVAIGSSLKSPIKKYRKQGSMQMNIKPERDVSQKHHRRSSTHKKEKSIISQKMSKNILPPPPSSCSKMHRAKDMPLQTQTSARSVTGISVSEQPVGLSSNLRALGNIVRCQSACKPKSHRAGSSKTSRSQFISAKSLKSVSTTQGDISPEGSKRRLNSLEKQKLHLFQENLNLQHELQTLQHNRLEQSPDALQDLEYLRTIYERRCDTLSEIALHWKEKTKLLAGKYYQTLKHLRQDNDRLVRQTREKIQSMKLDFDSTVAKVMHKNESVGYVSDAQDKKKLLAGLHSVEDENLRLRRKIQKMKKMQGAKRVK